MMLRREWGSMDRGDIIVIVVLLSKPLVDGSKVLIVVVLVIG